MVERKLFILEAYYIQGNNRQMWRVTTPGGLSWYANIEEFTFIPLEICRTGVLEQVSAIQALLESSGDKWKFLGVLSRGPNGNILRNDGERYRKAILEKVATRQHVCNNCGMVCSHSETSPPVQGQERPTEGG
ncbi:hypothetical protein H2200_003646 [Cladophialophora chaetospira]|uniref:Uncharacterized protein n=1 Tax=Cladophialophora chaetospira TaxID=386627 RepID=A0AA39CL85_9EURO|nr:hypothetical protein H2200_003646 [Cladophialophora chaetospira]